MNDDRRHHDDDDFVTHRELKEIMYGFLRLIQQESGELRMADEQIAAEQAAEASALASVTGDLATLATDTKTALEALTKKIAEGSTVTAAEAEAILSNATSIANGLTAVDASIKAQDAVVNPPAPAPAPEPAPAPAPEPTPAPAPAPAPEEG